MPEIMKYSVCSGGRQAVALKPQQQAIHKFFASFTNPLVIKQEETDGLLAEQIKAIYKESAGYFTVGHAAQRDKTLMEYATMIVLDGDYEGQSSLEAVHRVLSQQLQVQHLIHTSWTEGRWRLILPLDSEIGSDEIKGLGQAFVAKMNEAGLTVQYVQENAIISQPWFRPVILEGGDYTCRRVITGDKLDPLDYYYNSKDKKAKTKLDKEQALKSILAGDELHMTSNRMIMSMLSYGLPAVEVQNAVQGMLLSAKHEFQQSGNYSRVKEIEERIKDLPRSITGAIQKIDNRDRVKLPNLPETVKVNELGWPPGILGELSNELFLKSIYPIKEVCIVSALGLIAGIGGRTYNINRSGINLYLTLLMRTGMGKDAIQKFVSQILTKHPQGRTFIGAKTYTSGKALAEEFRIHRAKLCVFTEAGFMYRSSAGSPETLQRNILDYYSKSGKNDYVMPEKYSSHENSVEGIKAPSLTIINESTPEIFNQSMMARDSVNTGERARMIAFNITSPKPYINQNHGDIKLPPMILNRFDDFFKMCAQNQTKDMPDTINIDPPADYYDIINGYVDRENAAWNEGRALEGTCLTRAGEKLNRLLGCMSAIECPTKPTVTQEMVDWSISLIEYELATVYNFIGADSEYSFYSDVVGPIIVRLLKNEGPMDTRDEELHKKNRFSISNLNKMFTQKKDIARYLGHECRTKDTLQIIQHFIDLGYIQEPRQVGKNRRVCEVTPAFLGIFKQS